MSKRLPIVGTSREPSLPSAQSIGRVAITVTGSNDDVGAMQFATVLAQSMKATLWTDALSTESTPPPGLVVATGLALTRRLDARLSIVISGGVSRASWRDPTLPCDLELTDVRVELACVLGSRLAAQAKSW